MRVRQRARQNILGDALDRGLESYAGARQRHLEARALFLLEDDGRRRVGDIAAERGRALTREGDRARGLLGGAERAHSPSTIGVPPCARMRAAKIAAFRAPPIAMQPTGTPGGI